MLRMLNTIMEIRGVSGANRLIYYFRGIPVLGKTMKDSVYSNWALKKTFTVIALILRILFAFSTRFAYLGLIIYLPVLMAAGDLPLTQQYDLYLHILVLLSFAVSAVSNAIILESKRDKYICVKLMRMPADKYMHATLGLKGISFLFILCRR